MTSLEELEILLLGCPWEYQARDSALDAVLAAISLFPDSPRWDVLHGLVAAVPFDPEVDRQICDSWIAALCANPAPRVLENAASCICWYSHKSALTLIHEYPNLLSPALVWLDFILSEEAGSKMMSDPGPRGLDTVLAEAVGDGQHHWQLEIALPASIRHDYRLCEGQILRCLLRSLSTPFNASVGTSIELRVGALLASCYRGLDLTSIVRPGP